MGLRGVCICPTRSHALIGSIDHDGSLSANHWRRGHIASEDHGWFRHRPLTAGSRKLSLMMPDCYAPLSHFRMKFEALRAVGIFFSQRLHESGNDGQDSLQRGQVAVTSSAHYLLTRPNNAQRKRIRTPDLSGSICRGILRRQSGRDPPLIHAAVVPELPGSLSRIDAGILPPGGFVPYAVHQSVMDSTQRHRELIARLATQGPRLQVAQMVGV